MFKNHLKIAWRSLLKNKTFTVLNIIGLSVAFSVAILLGMAAFFDLSYDRFHERADNIYQVYTVQQTAKGSEAGTSNPAPLSPILRDEVPGVEKITRHLSDNILVMKDENELTMDAVWIDSDFFSIFSFPAVKGNAKHALSQKSSIVLTESASKTLFGTAEAMGETLDILIAGKERPFTVSAVLQDIPQNSSLDFKIALNFEDYPAYTQLMDDWDSQNHEVYLQLEKDVSSVQFEKSTESFADLHYKGTIDNAIRDGAMPNDKGRYFQVRLLPFKDIHFTTYENGFAKTAKTYPFLVLGVAVLILFIACVNFINMNIATSAQRLREIGMRKTLGALKTQLFVQFWGESLLVFLISLTMGLLLSNLLQKPFQALLGGKVSFESIATPLFMVYAFIAIGIITLFAGGYPALLLSRIGTSQALKGKLVAVGKNRVRNALIIVQFGIAILLINGTLVLWGQLEYMHSKDLGFNKEQVIAFPLNGKKSPRQAVQLLRNELLKDPNIISITAADNILGRGRDGSTYRSILGFEHKGRVVKTNMLVVDHDYAETLDLELVSGRAFNRQYATDSLAVMVNEAMAKSLNGGDPINTRIVLDDSLTYSVIGVLKDYHFEKLDKEIAPITLFMNKDWELYYAYVKIAPKNIAESFDRIKDVWNKIEPNATFLGSFLDENVDRTFQREKVMTTMISSGSIIAIILSCIGLFAISLLVVSQRTKEIGIRKVVGASVGGIVFMLTKDFLKLVFISFIIASPLAWWLMDEWLMGYAYRITLHPGFLLTAGILAILIALATIGTRTIKAANQNPVKSLRTE